MGLAVARHAADPNANLISISLILPLRVKGSRPPTARRARRRYGDIELKFSPKLSSPTTFRRRSPSSLQSDAVLQHLFMIYFGKLHRDVGGRGGERVGKTFSRSFVSHFLTQSRSLASAAHFSHSTLVQGVFLPFAPSICVRRRWRHF